MLLVGAFSLWLSITLKPFNVMRLVFTIGAVSLGAGVAALQLLPTAELLSQSQRSGGVDYDFAMNFSYSLPRVAMGQTASC
jgi:hypothetical protein